MDFNSFYKKTERLIVENSTILLTGVGVAGTITTAVLTGRASFKAARVMDDIQTQDISAGPITNKEIISEVWSLYLPAAGVGTVTIVSIIFANRISSKKMAALAAAYGISEKAFHEYKEKVVQHLGNKKELAVRDEIAQDRVNNKPLDGREIILVGNGDVLCYDAITGRYFMSSMENIKKAENKVNYEILHHMYASLSMFYEEIGIPPTSYSDEVGWNSDHILDVMYSTVLSSDGRPCISIDFKIAPVPSYTKFY